MGFRFGSAVRIALCLLLLVTIATAFLLLPIDKVLKNFLIWIKEDLGPWGPLVLIVAYIPLTVLAVPASVLTLGGGYLFGLPLGLLADSVGATLGATTAFLLGRTIGRSYVLSKIKNYPKFEAIATAIHKSGFKPTTLAVVYVGTTLKDLSAITHGWDEFSTTNWVFIVTSIGISVTVMVCITRIAKASLDKALAEDSQLESVVMPSVLPILVDSQSDFQKPLILSIDPSSEDHEI